MSYRMKCRGTCRKMSITTRTHRIIDKSRSLSFQCISWICKSEYHRRHFFCIKHDYGVKSPIDSGSSTKIGNTLRNRKLHVPKYKIERCDLDWVIMTNTRSVSTNWRNSRINWIEHCRNIEKLQTKHLDKIILPHWWKI